MIRGALVLLLHHDKHHAAYVKNLNTASPLSPSDLALTIGLGLCPVTLLELQKLLRRGLGRAPDARNV